MTYSVDFCLDLGEAQSGLVLSATIKTMAGVAFASGVGGWTEDPVGSGVYWGTYALFVDDVHYRAAWFSGADLVGVSPVSPIIYTVSVAAVVDQAALIAAVRAYFSGAPVTFS